MANDPNKVIYSMIGVSKVYDKKPVLKEIYLSYFYGAKIGVLGLNGSGKSSLLRILAGVDTDFIGKTILSPDHTVGFLEQEPHLDETRTVREIVEEGVQETVDLLNEFNEINEKFAEPMDDAAMTNSSIARRRSRRNWRPRTPGTLIPGWKWRWTRSVARRVRPR